MRQSDLSPSHLSPELADAHADDILPALVVVAGVKVFDLLSKGHLEDVFF